MFRLLRWLIGRWLPLRVKIYHRAFYNYHFGSEPELRLIKYICDPGKAAIDVGANVGIYTYFLKAHSSACYAIEPNPALRDILDKSFGRGVIVLPYALSDREGTDTLRIPIIENTEDRGRATIEAGNDLDGHLYQSVSVERTKLDNLNLPAIGLIKIDVEGHELPVLQGARALLERDHPAIIVESEERHCQGAVRDVHRFLDALGYKCFFLLDNRLHHFDEFIPTVHQNINNVGDMGKISGRVYVNNFIFIHNLENYPDLLIKYTSDINTRIR